MNTRSIKDLLWEFTGDDEYRPQFQKPFTQDDYVFATDTHEIIRIPKALAKEEYSELAKPKANSVIPPSNPTFELPWQSIVTALNTYDLDPDDFGMPCPECKDGTVEWTYTDKYGEEHSRYGYCPVCDGAEELPNGCMSYVLCGDKLFNCYSLIRILHAMLATNTEVAKVTTSVSSGWRFDLNQEVVVVSMPSVVRKTSLPTLKVEKP